MRVLFALLAFAAVSVSARTISVVSDDSVTRYLLSSADPEPFTNEANPLIELDTGVVTVFNLNVSSTHPFGFANPSATNTSNIVDVGATVSEGCTKFGEVFAWYNTNASTPCTVTLPAQTTNDTALGYRCAVHEVMSGILHFTLPQQDGSTGLNPSPIDSSTGVSPATSSTGGATPVPTPTPTPKPGAAAAQISGVVGLAVALISALFL